MVMEYNTDDNICHCKLTDELESALLPDYSGKKIGIEDRSLDNIPDRMYLLIDEIGDIGFVDFDKWGYIKNISVYNDSFRFFNDNICDICKRHIDEKVEFLHSKCTLNMAYVPLVNEIFKNCKLL